MLKTFSCILAMSLCMPIARYSGSVGFEPKSYSVQQKQNISQSLWDVIPLITLLQKINKVFPVHVKTPTFVSKVHKDNQSYITMATSHKFSPPTKHITLEYHHFCSHVNSGVIQISYCHTNEQKADILTKPLVGDLFFKLCYMLCGW
jgi:hypothetical protein